MADEQKAANDINLNTLKHDIRNQLSNIALSVEQLKYELSETNDDVVFYIETIAAGCTRINDLLKKID